MGTEIDDTQLRRFVVRVQTADGEIPLGTGVLVAPGWALTCAHVVEGLEEVRLVPDRGAGIDDAGGAAENAPPAHVPAVVRARSAPRDPAGRTAFWPFPDLAVLELSGWAGHVCAPLVTAEPVRTSQPHAWGFGRARGQRYLAGRRGVVHLRRVGRRRLSGLDGRRRRSRAERRAAGVPAAPRGGRAGVGEP